MDIIALQENMRPVSKATAGIWIDAAKRWRHHAMVEQVLSKARHYLMRFHRPAKLKLERWHGFLIKQHASPLGGACFLYISG